MFSSIKQTFVDPLSGCTRPSGWRLPIRTAQDGPRPFSPSRSPRPRTTTTNIHSAVNVPADASHSHTLFRSRNLAWSKGKNCRSVAVNEEHARLVLKPGLDPTPAALRLLHQSLDHWLLLPAESRRETRTEKWSSPDTTMMWGKQVMQENRLNRQQKSEQASDCLLAVVGIETVGREHPSAGRWMGSPHHIHGSSSSSRPAVQYVPLVSSCC